MSDSIFQESGSSPEAVDQQTQEASNQQEVQNAEASQETDQFADLLSGIKSEDGRPKYSKVEDALASIPHAQAHISTLEGELDSLREQLKEQVRHQPPETPQEPQGFNEDQVAGLVDQVLSQREREAISQRNVGTVVSQLTDKFGSAEAADKAYRMKAEELGMSMTMMNSLSMESPSAVLSYFGNVGASAPAKTDEGTINTANIPQNQQAPKGSNPLLTGSMADMQSEWTRIKNELNL